MRVLIVDDEPLAQTALANILSARSDVEHFDSANDASEALENLASDSYDVLLLDINMLDLLGTELVDQLRERNFPLPSIVFATAPVEHAIAAFERHTVDYVLRPFLKSEGSLQGHQGCGWRIVISPIIHWNFPSC